MNIYKTLANRWLNSCALHPVGIFLALQRENIWKAITLMNYSKASKKFLSQSAEAYYKFEHHEIPFAAVKIYLCGLESDWEKLDDVVRENFRSENDFFLKSNTQYAILMHNTTLEAAEEATHRLGVKLRLVIYGFKNKDSEHRPFLSAYIYGVGEASKKLQFRYLDAFNFFYPKKESEKWPTNFREYLKRLEPLKTKEHKPINIIV